MKRHRMSFLILGGGLLAWIMVGMIGQHFQQPASTLNAQTLPKANPVPAKVVIPPQCKNLYDISLLAAKEGDGGNSIQGRQAMFEKSIAYSLAYRNCLTQ